MTLTPEVLARVERLLDRAAERLLAERLERERLASEGKPKCGFSEIAG